MPRMHRSRRGIGVAIVIVVVFVRILAVVGISQGYFASFVADQSLKSSMGDLAADLAANAQTEAHFRLAHLVNAPGGAAYSLVRERTDGFSLAVPQADLPVFSDILKGHPGFVLEGGAVQCTVVRQGPASGVTPSPHDKYGWLRLEAAVSYAPLRVTRRLARTFDVRVCLTHPPRFFDANTVFIAEPEFLINSYAVDNDANTTITRAVEQLKNLAAFNEKLLQKLQEAASQPMIPASDKANLDEMIRLVRDVRDKWPTVQVDPDNLNTDAQPTTLHLFPRPPLALFTNAETVDLGALNLPDKVKDRQQRIQAATEALQQVIRQIENDGNASSSRLLQYVQRYHDEVLILADQLRGLLLDDYKGFQDAFVEVTGDDYKAFEPYLRQLDKNDLRGKATQGLFEKDPFEMDDGRDITTKVRDLLDRGPAASGLLYVVNPTQELTVDRTFRGRLVLVVERDVTIRRAVVEDPAQDLLTIVCFGRMAVEGPVQASLMPWGTYRCDQGRTIDGSVIFNRVNFVAGQPADVMTGVVRRNPNMPAGPETPKGQPSHVYPGAMHVSLAPAPSYVETGRR